MYNVSQISVSILSYPPIRKVLHVHYCFCNVSDEKIALFFKVPAQQTHSPTSITVQEEEEEEEDDLGQSNLTWETFSRRSSGKVKDTTNVGFRQNSAAPVKIL